MRVITDYTIAIATFVLVCSSRARSYIFTYLTEVSRGTYRCKLTCKPASVRAAQTRVTVTSTCSIKHSIPFSSVI
ncbi:hypothetical protein V8F33_012860 [Rhypophila sp. PSN 637]